MKLLIAILALAPCVAQASFNSDAVAAVLVAEAGGEGTLGMAAVREVIHNRAISGKTELAVVSQRYQFSCLNHVTLTQLIARAKKHPRWAEAVVLASSPCRTHLVNGATHFDSVKYKRPAWAVSAPVAAIGLHRFYRI